MLFFFCKYCRRVSVSVPSSVIFWMLFNFQKKKKLCISCFSKALFTCDERLMCSLWRHQMFFSEGGLFCQDIKTRTTQMKRFRRVVCEVSCVGFVCSTVKVEPQIPQFTKTPGSCSVLPPAPSVKCIFILIMFLLTVINSLNLPSQHAQSKDIFPHLCIVSEVSGVHFLWYVLYYSDGKWVHVYNCKSLGRLSTRDSLFHSRKLWVQREEDWKLSTPQRNVFFYSRKRKACFAVMEKYQWNEIHFKTYQYLIYFSGKRLHFMSRFCYFRKKGTL